MARDRDVAAFGRRARRYDEGWRGRLHHQIADRASALALTCVPTLREGVEWRDSRVAMIALAATEVCRASCRDFT